MSEVGYSVGRTVGVWGGCSGRVVGMEGLQAKHVVSALSWGIWRRGMKKF